MLNSCYEHNVNLSTFESGNEEYFFILKIEFLSMWNLYLLHGFICYLFQNSQLIRIYVYVYV